MRTVSIAKCEEFGDGPSPAVAVPAIEVSFGMRDNGSGQPAH